MKTKKLIVWILVILAVAYCGIACLAYDESSSVEILCIAGSEAERWAKHHGADYSLIADTELTSSQLHLGTFDYDLKNGGCVIVGCHTTRSEIVIPTQMDSVVVVGVEETAFDGCHNVTDIYVPETVTRFIPVHTEQYVVHCYENSDTYSQLQKAAAAKAEAEALKAAADAAPAAAVEAEKEAQLRADEADAADAEVKTAREEADAAAELAAEPGAAEDVRTKAEELAGQVDTLAAAAEETRALAEAAAEIAAQKREEANRLAEKLAAIEPETFVVAPIRLLRDSDLVNFASADIPFSYNKTGSGVELTAYTGQSAQVIVPETIDGISVTAISFPVEEFVHSVLIPASVTEIRSSLAESRYDAVFFFNLSLVILGLVIALTATNLAAKRSQTDEQRFLGVSLIYSGIKYFVLLLIWAAVSLYFGISIWVQISLSAVLLVAAPIELMAAGTAAKKVESIGAEVRKNTMFIRAYRSKAENLEARASDGLKTCCNQITEAFRYADPVSHASLLAAEDRIAARFETFSSAVLSGNEAAAKALAVELLVLIEERNRTCKLLK